MGQPALQLPLSASAFLAWETAQPVKHELVRGAVFAMAGASEAHVTTAMNIAMALRQHLAGSPCRTVISDMKQRVEAEDAFFYPDVMVTCSPDDARDPLVKREPLLLVEVLSPATAADDRGDKFAAYRQLPSLREYLVVDPASRRSDLYRLDEHGRWVLFPSPSGQGVQLDSVGLAIRAETLWADVPLEDGRNGDGAAGGVRC
jgi:Uma2 family endonuclease